MRKTIIYLSVVFLSLAVAFLHANAEEKNWFGGTGIWENPSNWDPYGVPGIDNGGPFDNVDVTNDPGSSATLKYTIPDIDWRNISKLSIYGTNEKTMTFSMSGGNLSTRVGIDIGNNAIVDQTGGQIMAPFNTVIQKGGTYNLKGGQLRMGENSIRVDGVFNQTGGLVGPSLDNFIIGQGGVYNLSSTGVLNSGNGAGATDQVLADAVFNQNGGTVKSHGLTLRGTYNLTEGEFYSIRDYWAGNRIFGGTFNQSGGTATWGGVDAPDDYNAGLYVGVDYDGTTLTEEGTYNLSGGKLETQGAVIGDRLNYSGGEMVLGHMEGVSWVKDKLTNDGTTNLSGSGTRVIDGNIENNGTFKTTHTTAVYNGTFTNNGAYISDPASQFFDDLIIGETGYLVGQHSDDFYIYGDFINHSTMNYDWNTKHAYLGFLEGEDNLHDFYLTGEDYGATMSGYADNFSWGTFDLVDNFLTLFDGNEEFGAALYLRQLLGAEILGDTIMNIIGNEGFTIYYNPHLKGNSYLAGLTYNLTGGGYLKAAVPEPVTLLLLCLGLIGLAGFRRRFNKS